MILDSNPDSPGSRTHSSSHWVASTGNMQIYCHLRRLWAKHSVPWPIHTLLRPGFQKDRLCCECELSKMGGEVNVAQRFRGPWRVTMGNPHCPLPLSTAPGLPHRNPGCQAASVPVAAAEAPTWKMASGMGSAPICTSSTRTVQVPPSAMTLRGLLYCAVTDVGPHCAGR